MQSQSMHTTCGTRQGPLPLSRQVVDLGVHVLHQRTRAAPLHRANDSRRQVQQQQQQQQADAVEDEAPEGLFSAVVGRLLNRAATSLTRGTTTCLSCKGKGTCNCPMCKGTGITDEQHSRPNVMRHTVQKMRQVLHVERSEYHTDDLRTNRCRRCHGAGAIVCPTCAGMGIRHAAGTNPPQ